jgi:hypothetical protein
LVGEKFTSRLSTLIELVVLVDCIQFVVAIRERIINSALDPLAQRGADRGHGDIGGVSLGRKLAVSSGVL